MLFERIAKTWVFMLIYFHMKFSTTYVKFVGLQQDISSIHFRNIHTFSIAQ